MKMILKTYPAGSKWYAGILHTVVTGIGDTPEEAQESALKKGQEYFAKQKREKNISYMEIEI